MNAKLMFQDMVLFLVSAVLFFEHGTKLPLLLTVCLKYDFMKTTALACTHFLHTVLISLPAFSSYTQPQSKPLHKLRTDANNRCSCAMTSYGFGIT